MNPCICLKTKIKTESENKVGGVSIKTKSKIRTKHTFLSLLDDLENRPRVKIISFFFILFILYNQQICLFIEYLC